MIESLSPTGTTSRPSGVAARRLHRRRRSRPSTTRPTSPGATSRCREQLEARVDADGHRSTTTRTPPAGPSSASAQAAASSDMVMLTIGTGVGGAIVADGRLFRGGLRRRRPSSATSASCRDGLPCGCGAARMPRAVRLGSRPAAHGERDRRRRRHRPGARRAPASEHGALDGRARRRAHRRRTTRERSQRCAELGHWLGEACASLRRVLDPAAASCSAAASPSAGELLLEPDPRGVPRAPARRAATTPSRDFVIAELVQRRRRRRRGRPRPRALGGTRVTG